MELKGWNQVETAKRSGVGHQTISAILSGRIKGDNITTKNASKLAKAFGITVDELLDRDIKITNDVDDEQINYIVELLMKLPKKDQLKILDLIETIAEYVDPELIKSIRKDLEDDNS
jgi:transcriptional regulator with XRE-family HTH domain